DQIPRRAPQAAQPVLVEELADPLSGVALLGGRAGRGGRRARGRGRSGDPLREIRVEVVHLAGFGDDLVPARRGPDLAEPTVRVVAMLGGDRTVVQVGAEVVAFRRVDAA